MYMYKHQTTRLLEGALLGTIAHALWVAPDPALAGMQEWSGTTYLLNDFSGAHGAIDFSTLVGVPELAAVFATAEAGEDRERPAGSFFDAAPPARHAQVQEALQFVLYEEEGEVRPVVTAAFWSENGFLAGPAPWSETRRGGAHLIDTQLLPPQDAIVSWQADYDLTDRQTTTLRALFERRKREPRFTAEPAVTDVLAARGRDGFPEAVALLAAIGISLEG